MGVLALLTTLLGLGGDALKRYQDKKQLEATAAAEVLVAETEARVKLAEKKVEAEISWDQSAVSQMETSWKDEWFTVLLSVPLILAFLGDWGRDVVKQGFEALKGMPEWYAACFLGAVAASFGLRKIIEFAKHWKK